MSPEARARAFADIPELRDVGFQTSDGLRLVGWHSSGRNGATVVLVHGLGGNRTQMLPEATMLARHGYGVLLYDSRASGASEGDLVTWGDREQKDVVAALDYLGGRPGIDRERIALLGFSVGASTVAMVAATDHRVRAAILIASWPSLEDEVRRDFGRYGPLSSEVALFELRRHGVNLDHVRPVDRIAEMQPRPLLMIAGQADRDTPVSAMTTLFRTAGEPKELWVVPGAGHGEVASVAPAQYEAKLTLFLDHALGSGLGGAPR